MFDALNANPKLRAQEAELRPELERPAARPEPHWRASSASFLVWGQHCVECAAPACYRTCGLYERAPDGRCRTFAYGLVRNRAWATLHEDAIECRFKPHAVLFAHLTLPQIPIERMRRIERLQARLAEPLANALDAPIRATGARSFFQRAANYAMVRRLYSLEGVVPDPPPDAFLLHVFNPGGEAVDLAVSIVQDPPGAGGPFLETVRLAPGFNECVLPFEDLAASIDFSRSARTSLFLPGGREATLVFAAADMVRLELPEWARGPERAPEDPPATGPTRAVKCVVFDLDDTLWRGTLLEDGDSIRLAPGVRRLLDRLDRRGILASVASRNDRDRALAKLAEFGIAEHFLHPRVDWEPKSDNLRRIAADLNIGLDSIAFVDDRAFEREQVASALPEVRVFSERDLPFLHRHPALRGSDSAESASRRRMYLAESGRRAELDSAGGDYDKFLRECGIVLRIEIPTEEHFERIHELAQRTNQLNFSGNRYSRESLRELLAAPDTRARILRVADRFGDYGIVGFAAIRVRPGEPPRALDLALSCRVQSRRIEHAFLSDAMRAFREEGAREFEAVYNKTDRNAPAGRVFDDLGFATRESDGDRLLLVRDLASPPPPPDFVRIESAADGEARG